MLPLNRNTIQEVLGLPRYWISLWRSNQSIEAGEKIAYGPHSRQHFRWFPPTGPLRAWLVYFHGGGWQFGTPYHFRALASIFKPLGIGLVLPTYRGLVSTNYQGMKLDLQAFYAQLSVFAKERNIPLQKVILGGMSAGGHLAALSALDPEIRQMAWADQNALRGIFLSGAVLNLDEMPASILVRRLAGKKGEPAWLETNPMNYLEETILPPCLLMHGTQDGMVPFRVAQSFFAKAKEKKENQIELHALEGGSHLDIGRWIYQTNDQRELAIKFVENCIV